MNQSPVPGDFFMPVNSTEQPLDTLLNVFFLQSREADNESGPACLPLVFLQAKPAHSEDSELLAGGMCQDVLFDAACMKFGDEMQSRICPLYGNLSSELCF